MLTADFYETGIQSKYILSLEENVPLFHREEFI